MNDGRDENGRREGREHDHRAKNKPDHGWTTANRRPQLASKMNSVSIVARNLELEQIDLAGLARELIVRVPRSARNGELEGRTVIRDAVMQILICSALQAEEIVDTLVARRFLVFRERPAAWEVRPDAS